ncbi:MAG: rane-associated lipoprotein involved in thiamine biosynthesis [Eubacterium sp.]|jgi:thiamine biosynthesis lipoprotein|nr:rane-associated lipoprotein involved in thiamine biosynthesis [Eubacterium sp.]
METLQNKYLGMNTVMTHRAFGKHAGIALGAVRNEALRLEELLSRFIPRSDISRINSSAGIKYEKLSNETYEVLSRAIEFSKYCFGSFDVTIGPLVTLWKEGRNESSPPEDSDIRRALALVDYKDLMLDQDKKAVKLQKAGQSIDLGGIGKGYAADRFLEVFRQYEVTSAFTNIGGNVATLGAKPDGSPWCVGIQHPRQEDSLVGIVCVVDKSVVTSGDYQRYFIGSNGKRYHHILDPSTGYPAESGLASITIIGDNSMAADALSTILFVEGMEKGVELLRRFSGIEAIFIDKDLQVHITDGLKESFIPNEGISVDVL